MEDSMTSPEGNSTELYVSEQALDWLRTDGWGDALVPLHVGTKRPIGDNWRRVWTKAALDVKAAQGCNWGVQTSEYPALDVEGTEWAGNVRAWISSFLAAGGGPGTLEWRHREGSESTLCLTRLKDPFGLTLKKMSIVERRGDGTTRKLFELLADGQQAHVSGVHPEGMVVRWGSGGDYVPPQPNALPVVDVDMLQDLMEGLHRYLREDLGLDVHVTGLRDLDLDPDKMPDPEECSVEELSTLLAHMPNSEGHYDWDEWVKYGHAIKKASGGSPEGYDAWVSWSAQHPLYDEELTRERWEGFDLPNIRAGVGTIREEAKRRDPQGLAKSIMDELPEVEDPKRAAKVNPLTGEKRYLWKDVQQTARATADSTGVSLDGFTSWGDFERLALSAKMPEDIIPGFIRPNVVHGVSGAPGANKSTLMLHYALCGIWGLDPLDAQRVAHPVIVIANFGEDSDVVVQARALAIRQNYASHVSTLRGTFRFISGRPLEIANLDPRTNKITPEPTMGLVALCDYLELIIKEHREVPGPDVAIMQDMLKHAVSGDENLRWVIDAVFSVWRAIMICVPKHGGPLVGFAFSHHMTKTASRGGGSSSGFNSAGSIGIEGNSRMMTEVSKLNDDPASAYIKARVVKDNYGQGGRVQWWERMQVSSPLGGTSIWVRPTEDPTGGGAMDPYELEAMVAALHDALTGEAQGQDRPVVANKNGKVADGCVHVWDLVRGEDGERVMGTRDMLDTVLKAGEERGAWVVRRTERWGVEVARGVIVSDGWAPDV